MRWRFFVLNSWREADMVMGPRCRLIIGAALRSCMICGGPQASFLCPKEYSRCLIKRCGTQLQSTLVSPCFDESLILWLCFKCTTR